MKKTCPDTEKTCPDTKKTCLDTEKTCRDTEKTCLAAANDTSKRLNALGSKGCHLLRHEKGGIPDFEMSPTPASWMMH